MPDDILETNAAEQAAHTTPEASKPAVGGDGAGTAKQALPTYTEQVAKAVREKLKPEDLPPKLDELVTGYIDLRGKVANAIVRPAADAPKEAWEAYHKAMGVPASPDGYAFSKVTLPEGMDATQNQTFEKWFRAEAHAAGVPAEQAQKLYDHMIAQQITGFTQQQEQAKKTAEQREAEQRATRMAAQAELETKYGVATTQVVRAANEVFKRLPAKDQAALKAAGLTNSAAFVSLLYDYGRASGSDSQLGIGNEPGSAAEKDGFDYGAEFNKKFSKKK